MQTFIGSDYFLLTFHKVEFPPEQVMGVEVWEVKEKSL